MWAEMALQLQLNMGPMSSYPHLALEKMVTGWWFGTFFSIIYGIILPID
jgi:hypothetical protein